MSTRNLANVIVDSLANAGVSIVFGIPGAKVDGIFDALSDHPTIRLIICRHEQNAAFMAAAVGRLTGVPGVCLVTSGPGTSNLVTGLATATSEGDPVIAIAGTVSRLQAARHTHQALDVVKVLEGVCKSVTQVSVEDQVSEVVVNAFRRARRYPQGASAVALPMDLIKSTSVKTPPFPSLSFNPPTYGSSNPRLRNAALDKLLAAKSPVILLGMRSANQAIVAATQRLIKDYTIPVVETFQAAGAISEGLLHRFYGRVGLFRNQPGDKVLARADVILAIGYDPFEYDAESWNVKPSCHNIIHIDYTDAKVSQHYLPDIELIGNPADIIDELNSSMHTARPSFWNGAEDALESIRQELDSWEATATVGMSLNEPVQPIQFVYLLRHLLPKETVVAVDVGTVYIYMMRYFRTYLPHHLLCSNGQQTLGVGLPWAIAASLSQKPVPCAEKVVSISGDGGFMFSSQELATAVQQGCNITHFIWNDSAYNMVEFQEEAKYGRSSGIRLGGVDFVKFAEAFDAKGFRVRTSGELESVMRAALAVKGVAIVEVVIDYSKSNELMRNVIPDDYK
ncbi:putative acetolactate synthase [Talaromyces proteolyticus]|uniref:Acetolactate synthase n=1 Tax=Talaromyces proteolyticus TaxID=1131652 RepID=A0AAD4Q1Y2_9EURO|nr:putative acetolactate synthase [Talaromyces proteolyticus]KAH8699164.1 putative acetolactate synthase [Talaromyces proteolyticus]